MTAVNLKELSMSTYTRIQDLWLQGEWTADQIADMVDVDIQEVYMVIDDLAYDYDYDFDEDRCYDHN